MRNTSFVSLAIVFATACVADDTDDTAPTDDIVRTVVVLQPDGRDPIVTTEHITAAEHQAELGIHEALARGERPLVGYGGSSNCAASDMWIFDNTGNTIGAAPFNHEICFYKNSVSECVDLRTYARLCSPWGCSYWGTNGRSWIQSFWAGIDEGWFAGLYEGYADVMTSFRAYDRQDFAATSNTDGQDPDGVAWAQYLCFP